LDLALHSDESPVHLKDIARRQQISLPYLEHLVAPLVSGEIIRSIRGARGGISLLKPTEKIRLSDVIRLLEGSISPVECVTHPDICPRAGFCATCDIWRELNRAMNKVLETTTLQELVERQRQKEKSRNGEMLRAEEAVRLEQTQDT